MIILIIMISYINFSNYSTDNNLENLSLTSFAISKAVEERINDYFNLAEYTSKMYSLAPNDNLEDNLNYILEMLNYLASQSKLIDTSFALKDGRTYSNIWKGIVPEFNAIEKKKEWFTRIINGEKNVITTPYTSSTGDVVMTLSVPVIVGGEIEGVLLINLPIDEITNFTKMYLVLIMSS